MRCNKSCSTEHAVKLAASQAWLYPTDTPYKALPPLVSHLTPSRRKAFVPKFLSFLSHFVVGWRCYFALENVVQLLHGRALIYTERKEHMSFEALGLHASIVKAVTDAGYTKPTPVQEQAVPAAIAGKDLLVSSQTGSGKTAAFMLPSLTRLATLLSSRPCSI